MSRRLRISTAAASTAAAVAAAALVITQLTGGGTAPREHSETEHGDEMPAALGHHLEQLREASPQVTGAGGEPVEEGPSSGADAAFDQRAYPAHTISLAKATAQRQAFAAAAARFQSLSAAQRPAAGRWAQAGPSRALYPFSELRNYTNYVPNRYVAGGRTTDVAIAPTCSPGDCRLWVTPAGGGVWRTDHARAKHPHWTYLGGPLGINAAGTVVVDPTDPTGNTIWVGTGEANICGSGCVAGVGLYRSTNGGDTWHGPLGSGPLGGKGIGDIVVDPEDPNTVYAATTTALRGMSSVCCSGVTRPVPGAAKWGLYKSIDRGRTWTFIHNGSDDASQCGRSLAQFLNERPCSPRGVRDIELDPSDPATIYAASYARGIWRSTDAGDTWTNIKPSLNSDLVQTRAAFDVTARPNGDTRMYVYEGNIGDPAARLFRSDDVATGSPTFTDLSSSDPADPGFATYDQCDGQCWYDLFVYTPDGHPNVVYSGGSYGYGETGGISNGRAVVRSTDAGVSGTDMTMDGTDPVHPNAMHPDQHSLVTDPNNPRVFFETNDGGIIRSNGTFTDASANCAGRGLSGDELARCRQLLSSVPGRLQGINDGLSTLQFQSLSVSPFDPHLLQGGTQDNGTWQNNDHTRTWLNTIIGDGGQSGFDVAKPSFRFHNFYDASTEVNFADGALAKWIWTADPIYGQPGTEFYAPVISDPVVSGTMFAGTGTGVYRTQTFGLGNRSRAEAQRICNEFTGTFTQRCGDWKLTGQTPLTDPAFGDREGGGVAAIARAHGSRHTNVAWAATTTGRVFVSTNIDADDPSAVTWQRVDDDASNAPNRFVSGIEVDPHNPFHVWISYSGFSASTPSTPGHLFEVTYDHTTATFANRSGNLADQPLTGIARDPKTGDIYASTDFGVLRRHAGSWTEAAAGMPNVEVAGLTFVPGARILYAASHGRSAWRLQLGR